MKKLFYHFIILLACIVAHTSLLSGMDTSAFATRNRALLANIEENMSFSLKDVQDSGISVPELNNRLTAPPNGIFFLTKAIMANNFNAATVLLQAGANPNSQDKQQNTPLHITAKCCCDANGSKFVNKLIEMKAEPNAKNHYQDTPLHEAVIADNMAAAQALINNDAEINIPNQHGDIPLHEAMSGAMVKLLCQNNKETLLSRNKDGNTPLLRTIRNYPSKIEWDAHRTTAAAKIEAAKELIEQGASVAVKNYQDQTPLHLAIQQNCPSDFITIIINAVIKEKADLNSKDHAGNTPLHSASTHNNAEIITQLIQHGASINAQNNSGDTPLSSAVKANKKEAVTTLLTLEADKSIANSHTSLTPLQWLESEAKREAGLAKPASRSKQEDKAIAAEKNTKDEIKQLLEGKISPISLSVIAPTTSTVLAYYAQNYEFPKPIWSNQPDLGGAIPVPNSGQPGTDNIYGNLYPHIDIIAPNQPSPEQFNQQPKLPKNTNNPEPFGWLIQGTGTGVGIAAILILLHYFDYLPYVGGEKPIQHNLSQEELYTIITEALLYQEYKYALDTALANPYACSAIARDVTMQKHLEHLIDTAENRVADAAKAAAINPTTSFAKNTVSQNLHYLSQLWHLINEPGDGSGNFI